MRTISATEAKNTLSAIIDSDVTEPILVKLSEQTSVVILAASEYERLTTIEDAYWTVRAVGAEASGFATAEEVASLLEDSDA